MQIEKIDAVMCLGDWEVSNGNEISKPNNLPSDADINARQADMQTKADTGNYNTIKELIATYNS